jgi:hypothetical protein
MGGQLIEGVGKQVGGWVSKYKRYLLNVMYRTFMYSIPCLLGSMDADIYPSRAESLKQ